MNKEMFLEELKRKLIGLPQADIDERLAFYSEMIDDRIEDGLTEEEAVAKVGSVDEIVAQIMSEIPLTKLVKEKVKPKRSLRVWEIVLIVLGFPVWFPLLIAFLAIVFAVYVVIWSLAIAVYAVTLGITVSAVACIPGTIICIIAHRLIAAVFCLGAGVLLAGIAILLFFACIGITKGMLKLTKGMLMGIKRSFVGKEEI